MIYLDHAAATPLSDKAHTAMQPFWQERFFNASGLSLASRQVRSDITNARKQAAQLLGVNHQRVIFPAGASEANSLAILGLAARYPGTHMLTCATEHDAVLAPIKLAGELFDVSADIIGVDSNGDIDPAELKAAIRPTTVLVSLMQINNETGVIHNTKALAQALHSHTGRDSDSELPLVIHSDGSQSGALSSCNLQQLGVDLLTLNGAKMYGPKQSAILAGSALPLMTGMVRGGGQEFGLRAGTESPAQIVGCATAFVQAQQRQDATKKRLEPLQQQLEAGLVALGGAINGRQAALRSSHITNVSLPGVDAERLVMELDEQGIVIAAGSACSARAGSGSHVLAAMGQSSAKIRHSVRISLGYSTSDDDITALLAALKPLVDNA